VENIMQFCWRYSSSIQKWKNFENRLRCEKVIGKSLVASFFGGHGVHLPGVIVTLVLKWQFFTQYIPMMMRPWRARVRATFNWCSSVTSPRLSACQRSLGWLSISLWGSDRTADNSTKSHSQPAHTCHEAVIGRQRTT